MPRRNGSTTVKNWDANTANAPFRASVNADTVWKVGMPPHDLAVAMRVSPGGRLLLAFELEGIRDYFVSGHRAANGAQVEADGTDCATRRRSPILPVPAQTLDESFARFTAARADLTAAEDAIERAFNDEIERLIAADDIQGALALTVSLPGDTVMKTIAISCLMKSEKWDSQANPLWKTERAPYTAERARLLAVWIEARNAYEAAQTAMERFLVPLMEGFVASKDRAGLDALIAGTPPSVARACLCDARDYRIGKPAA